MTDAPEDLPDPNDPVTGGAHDGFKKVMFGQLSEPMVRAHPEPPEAEEDELTRAALADPDAGLDRQGTEPTAWRWVMILLVAAVALGIVFGRR